MPCTVSLLCPRIRMRIAYWLRLFGLADTIVMAASPGHVLGATGINSVCTLYTPVTIAYLHSTKDRHAQ